MHVYDPSPDETTGQAPTSNSATRRVADRGQSQLLPMPGVEAPLARAS
jgi:hypothetical protein